MMTSARIYKSFSILGLPLIDKLEQTLEGKAHLSRFVLGTRKKKKKKDTRNKTLQ